MSTPFSLMEHLSILTGMSKWQLLGSLAGLSALAGLATRGWGKPALDTHGSAHFATAAEIRAAGLRQPHGYVLGTRGFATLRDNGPGHILLCGPSRSGKDRAHNFPFTRRYPYSMIILDIKKRGENWQHCGYARAKKGPVYVFAPTMRQSHSYNLLAHVRWGQPEMFGDVDAIAASLTEPVKREERVSSESEYYRGWGKIALRTGLLYTGLELPRKSLVGCGTHLAHMEEAVTAWCKHSSPLIHEAGKTCAQMPERVLGAVWTDATKPLDVYRNPLIAAHTERHEIPVRDLQYGAQPMTLYFMANHPTELRTLLPVFRPVIEQIKSVLQTEASEDRRPLTWLCNELPSFGFLHALETGAALDAEYRMRFVAVVQDLGQFFAVYGPNTALWGNCTTQIFHRPANFKTAKDLSEMLGEETVHWESKQFQGVMGRPTRTSHQGARSLMTAAELRSLPRQKALVWVDACPAPLLLNKLHYGVGWW